MTLGEFLSPVTALVRLITTLFGRKPSLPHKRLEARLLLRGIVAEIPKELPFRICDEEGNQHRGVYVIGMLIWNKRQSTGRAIGPDAIGATPDTGRR